MIHEKQKDFPTSRELILAERVGRAKEYITLQRLDLMANVENRLLHPEYPPVSGVDSNGYLAFKNIGAEPVKVTSDDLLLHHQILEEYSQQIQEGDHGTIEYMDQQWAAMQSDKDRFTDGLGNLEAAQSLAASRQHWMNGITAVYKKHLQKEDGDKAA